MTEEERFLKIHKLARQITLITKQITPPFAKDAGDLEEIEKLLKTRESLGSELAEMFELDENVVGWWTAMGRAYREIGKYFVENIQWP